MLVLQGGLTQQRVPTWTTRIGGLGAPVLASERKSHNVVAASLEAPLSEGAIADEVREAVRLLRRGDETAVTQRSRDCHRRLRARPELAQLDRCAAFDNAVAAIEDRDPMHDSSPFNASSVTARQMTAASLLSDDYLSIERRLDRIRTRVELRLTPPAPPPLVEVDPDPDGEFLAADAPVPQAGADPDAP